MNRLWLVGLGCCVLAVMSAAWADQVKLKDGTVLDGTILAEDDKQITIEVAFGSGTITRQELVDKSNVVEIVRLTPEQKAEQQMTRDYEKAKKNQLDPATNYPLAAYDPVINDVFRKYLAQYTNSPYQQEITGWIAQWEAERDMVASGQRKYRGQWMSLEEAGKLAEQDRRQRLLQLGRGFMAKGRYDEAIKEFHNLSETDRDPQVVGEARQLEAESYRLWLKSVEREQQRINREIKSSEERPARAQKAKERAEKGAGKTGSGKVRRMGADGFAFEAARAESEEKIAQNQASQLRKQLASVQQFASELRARIPGSTTSGQTSAQGASAQTGTASVPSAPEPTTAAAPAPVSADEASSVAWLNQIVQWGKQNWYLVAAAVVVLLWLVSRAIGR